MICPQCYNEAIENTANHRVFFYCRTCKSEVDEFFFREDPTEYSDDEWSAIERVLNEGGVDLDDDLFTGDDMT